MEDKKHKKLTINGLPFLCFLSPFEKSLKTLLFSINAIVPERAAHPLS